MSTLYRSSRIAGGILVAAAGLTFLFQRQVAAVDFVLGLALLIVQDSTRLQLVRLLVFGWMLVALVITIPGVLYEGMWVPAIRAALFGGALVGLMLDGLPESAVAGLCLIAAGLLYF